MKQILAPMEVMRSLVSQQKYAPEADYCRASFCLELPVEDGVILYHTLSGELLWMGMAEMENRFSDEALKKKLVQKRFLVPDGFDESRYADQVKAVAGLLQKEKGTVTAFTVFTTLDCNAHCFYCYEKGRPRPYMTDAVARDVADYMLRTSRGEKISLRWFGGEPLLNVGVIDIISSALKGRGATFTSSMVSNGYLFERSIIQRARAEWNLQKVQITLDGTESVYNRTKAFAETAGSPFQKVLGSIDMLLEAGIQVSVRLNMHRNNVDDLQKLTQELADRFSGKKQFWVYAALLRDSLGTFIGLEQQEALEAFRKLNRSLLELGLRKPGKLLEKPKTDYCMACRDGSVTVLPNGELGRCEHFSESELFGSIYSDRRDETVISAWKETIDRTDACRSCPCYPQCNLLKKCPYVNNVCTEIDRQMRLDELKEQVYAAYWTSIEEQGRKEESHENQV